ncbi:unnamed protein product, partial [Medioppia subpectinata]
VLKVAILAEKYASDYTWYVDVILNLIRIAGDYVSEEVWYRVIQIVINREDVQGYAAKTVFEALQAPACHENMVKVAGYILGEFGNLIAGDQRSSPLIQFQLLHSKYHLCSASTRALLLTTYVKFINLFPEIKGDIQTILKNHSNIRSADAELQQRTVEYLQLTSIASTDVLATVLEEMPPFPERESSILASLKKKKPGMTGGVATTGKEYKGTMNNNTLNDITSPVINTNASADLLGLNSSPPTAVTSNASLLVEVFGDSAISSNNTSALNNNIGSSGITLNNSGVVISNEEGLKKLVSKHNGVLFENDLLQIGVKAEYRQNLGRISLFYGNKTNSQFLLFFPSISCTEQLQKCVSLQAKPVEPIIEAGAQVQQQINVECINDFSDLPTLLVEFSYNGPQRFPLKLPLTLNKFLEQTVMNSETFFGRWKNLNNPSQEAQKIFKAKHGMDAEVTKSKLLGFGFELLENVDPNPENFVCAGIVHSKAVQVGVLLRLEPNMPAQALE